MANEDEYMMVISCQPREHEYMMVLNIMPMLDLFSEINVLFFGP